MTAEVVNWLFFRIVNPKWFLWEVTLRSNIRILHSKNERKTKGSKMRLRLVIYFDKLNNRNGRSVVFFAQFERKVLLLLRKALLSFQNVLIHGIFIEIPIVCKVHSFAKRWRPPQRANNFPRTETFSVKKSKRIDSCY